MDTKGFILEFKKLEAWQQEQLVSELSQLSFKSNYEDVLKTRGDKLDNKSGECSHCGSFNYSKFGSDKGSRRYMCLECKRTFTEYSGTWISGIHNKALIPEFLRTMEIELSLIKTGKELGIDTGTAFRWRHKFLSAVEMPEDVTFKGITETDETFFLESQKGKKCTHRKARKRGGGHK